MSQKGRKKNQKTNHFIWNREHPTPPKSNNTKLLLKGDWTFFSPLKYVFHCCFVVLKTSPCQNWRTKNIVTECLSEKSLTEIKLHARFEHPGLKNANHYKR